MVLYFIEDRSYQSLQTGYVEKYTIRPSVLMNYIMRLVLVLGGLCFNKSRRPFGTTLKAHQKVYQTGSKVK